MESSLTKTKMISELLRSPHGKLSDYIPVASQGFREDPEFMSHMIAWNEKNGSIRDSKIALPVISLSGLRHRILRENSLAHLALQTPRMLVRALKFAEEFEEGPYIYRVFEMVKRYIRVREEHMGWWNRTAIQYRKDFKSLYAMSKTKPSAYAQQVLFDRDYPEDSSFYAIAHMSEMDAAGLAEAITKWKLPYLIIAGAIGKRASGDSNFLYALIDSMSPTEVISHTAMLEKLGIKNFASTRSLFAKKLELGASTQAAFKATKAASMQRSESAKSTLQGVQERQIASMDGIDGDWLVLGDKSGSMDAAIEKARVVASTLARLITGKVHLIWFDASPRYMDVTGKTYDEILKMSSQVSAGGQTSIGCGLQYLLERHMVVDGIAIVSDGEENTFPDFCHVYQYYSKFDKEIPIYMYKVGNPLYNPMESYCQMYGIDVQIYDANNIDHYGLVNLVSTMSTKRYGMIEKIYDAPLLTLDDVFNRRDKDVGTA